MAITPLPTPPSTGSPANFDARADALLGALPLFVTEANELAASLNNISTTSTSETELTISTGEKTLTVETGKSYAVGQSVKIASTANGSVWMIGDVQSYAVMTGELVVDVQVIQGAGTISDWTVTIGFNGLISRPQIENISALPFMDTANTFTQMQTFSKGHNTLSVVLADNAATSIDLSALIINHASGIITIAANTPTIRGVARYRVGTSSGANIVNGIPDGASLVGITVLANTILTGTTGTDGNFTVGTNVDGKIYFENRTGATVDLVVDLSVGVF